MNSATRLPSPFFTVLFWIALLSSLILVVLLSVRGNILSQQIWLPEGLLRFQQYAAVFAAISVVFGLFLRRYFFPSLLAAILICTVFAVGPLAVLAVLLFVFSSTVLGRIVFGDSVEGPLAFLGGMAIWILAMNLTARLPIHYVAIYLIILALPVAIGYTHSLRLSARWLDLFRPGYTNSAPECFSFALLAFVMVAHWLLVLKPEVSTDGLTMHLAIASNIATQHAFTINFRETLWGLMPKGADWCYSIVYMLGGEYAARLLNFAMLVAVGVLLFGAARRFVSKTVAMVMVFLFMSTPMVQLVTASMFVENFVAAMTLGALIALWKYDEKGTTQTLFLTALLLGTSVALKLGGLTIAFLVLPLFITLMIRKESQPATILICAVAVVLAIGTMPYLNSYLQSGNPVFPFNNATFQSPYIGNNDVFDLRFKEPLSWLTPIRLTFQTHLYFEGQDGALGFQYLLFLPLLLIGLVPMHSFHGQSAAIIGLAGALVLAIVQPNARYFYVTLPFLTIGAAAALSCLRANSRPLFLGCLFAGVAVGVGNTYFLPASGWYHKDFYSVPLLSSSGREAYLRNIAPVRDAINYVNGIDRTRAVVLMDSATVADLAAPAFSNSWIGYQFLMQMRATDGPEEIFQLFKRLNVHHVILEPTEIRDKSTADLLAACGKTEYSVGGTSVVSLLPDCESRIVFMSRRPLAAGKHDDTDAELIYKGRWSLNKSLPSSYQQSVSYSDHPEALVRFTFTGRGFRYGYSKAFNRGMAEILIDGSQKSVVDLYSPKIEMQAQTTIDGLSPSLHEVTIRPIHEKDPRALGYFIDIDFVEIF